VRFLAKGATRAAAGEPGRGDVVVLFGVDFCDDLYGSVRFAASSSTLSAVNGLSPLSLGRRDSVEPLFLRDLVGGY
jgi:hypothetical protein